MEYKEMMQLLTELPKKIKEQELKIIALGRKINNIEDKKKEIDVEHFISVLSAKDAEGKNLYSNEKAREIQVNKQKKLDAVYQALLLEEEETIIASKTETADLEFLKRRFKSVEIVVSLLTRRLF